MSGRRLTWTRTGAKSGPANTLDGLYRVERQRPSTVWAVRDLTTGLLLTELGPSSTMHEAKARAEQHARGER